MPARLPRALVASALLALLCCGDLDRFEVAEESTATLPGATLLERLAGDVGFGGFLDMDLRESQELRNQGVEPHQIDSVRLSELSLSVAAPSGQDFTFLESLEFYVESAGLPRRRIARGGPFAAGAGRVDLELDDVELAPYAAAESMSITTEATGRRPPQSTTINAALRLQIDVDVTGAACGG